jgi:ribose 5-phosphate isomerase B
MRIALASDHAGFPLKRALSERLANDGHDVEDCGCFDEQSCDYPDFAAPAARRVGGGAVDRAILVCGTGIGMCMTANRIPGVRAALVHDAFTARMAREHNDSNVLCLGARVLEADRALDLVHLWLTTDFAGGRHSRRVDKINALDAGS